MTLNTIAIWIVQAGVTWLVGWDLGPEGSKFVARSLGLQAGVSAWLWLIGLAITSAFVNSSIAANTFAAYTGKRPGQDWHGYGQSGAADACYWCGLASFAISLLVVPVVFASVRLPGARAVVVSAVALTLSCVSVRIVVSALLRRRNVRSPQQTQIRP